jgi:Sec-independent protein translocase protein TatA
LPQIGNSLGKAIRDFKKASPPRRLKKSPRNSRKKFPNPYPVKTTLVFFINGIV